MLVSKINETMMQYFEWYLPPDCKLWEKSKNTSELLRNDRYNFYMATTGI